MAADSAAIVMYAGRRIHYDLLTPANIGVRRRIERPAKQARGDFMTRLCTTAFACLFLLSAAQGLTAAERVALVVNAGRPLRVRVDRRLRITHAGQDVTATVVEPVYAYDRIVIPAGSQVIGRIARLESGSKLSRVRAILGGDFTPRHTPVLQFDTLVLPDGTRLPITTQVSTGRENVALTLSSGAGAADEHTIKGRAAREATDRIKEAIADARMKAREAIAEAKEPGRMERFKELAVNQLPYHPQYLHAGTTYDAALLAPLDFGTAEPTERAPDESAPAPESILSARLQTALSSATTARVTAVHATLTEPVFTADHRLLLPEGTSITGEVTFAKRAASLHRNGQLRFLVENVEAPDRSRAAMLASLYGVETSSDDRVALDDEGGASVTDSKTRFIEPALAAFALRASVERDHRRLDNDADDVGGAAPLRSHPFAQGLSGFIGFNAVGAAMGLLSRPLAIGFGVWGAARTIYSNVIARGREVTFPADTPIKLQLASTRPAVK